MPSPAREISSINFESMLGGPLIAVVNAQAQAAMSSVNFIKSVGFRTNGAADPTRPETGDPIYVSFKYPKEVAPFQPSQDGVITGATLQNAGAGYDPANPPNVAVNGGNGNGATFSVQVAANGSISLTLTNPGVGYTAAPQLQIDAPPQVAGAQQATATADFTAPVAAQPAQFANMKLEVPILTMLPIPFIRVEESTIDFNAKINAIEETKTDRQFKVDSSLSASGGYPPMFSAVSAKLKVSASYQKNTQSGSKVERTYSMAVHIRAVQDDMPAGMERILGILEDAIKSQPANAPAPVPV